MNTDGNIQADVHSNLIAEAGDKNFVTPTWLSAVPKMSTRFTIGNISKRR